MADIELTREHALGLERAREAADGMLEHLERRFGLQGAWDGDVLRFERPGLTGALALTDKELHLTLSLGLLLRAVKGSIERAVVEELDSLFATPRKTGSARPKKGG